MRFLCKVSSDVKFTTFPSTTVLQRKLVWPSFALGRATEDKAAGRFPPIVRLLC